MNGFIYKLKCKDTDDFFIGSTTNLKKALTNLKCVIKTRDTPLFNYIKSHGGLSNFETSVILKCPINLLNLYKKQQINLLNPSLNIVTPLQTKQEYNQKNRQKINAYKKSRKIKCDVCYKVYSADSIQRHYKTKKHILNKKKEIKIIVI